MELLRSVPSVSGRDRRSTGVYENMFVSIGSSHATPSVLRCIVDLMLVSCLRYADFTVSGSAPCHGGLRTWLVFLLATSAVSPCTDSRLTDDEEDPTQSIP